jgi:hypothetical protein
MSRSSSLARVGFAILVYRRHLTPHQTSERPPPAGDLFFCTQRTANQKLAKVISVRHSSPKTRSGKNITALHDKSPASRRAFSFLLHHYAVSANENEIASSFSPS